MNPPLMLEYSYFTVCKILPTKLFTPHPYISDIQFMQIFNIENKIVTDKIWNKFIFYVINTLAFIELV